jgi:hypothetical protein
MNQAPVPGHVQPGALSVFLALAASLLVIGVIGRVDDGLNVTLLRGMHRLCLRTRSLLTAE